MDGVVKTLSKRGESKISQAVRLSLLAQLGRMDANSRPYSRLTFS